MSVSRETLRGLASRYGLPDEAAERFHRLLEALDAEPDPPTTARDPEQAIDVHIADSLSGLEIDELTRARAICDIGAGAGFPGLALAIGLPHARVDLVESSTRKADVIERLAAAAGVDNARALPERAETWADGAGHEAYDVVTARALAQLAVLLEYSAPLLHEGGALVAWKGVRDEGEEAAAARAAERLGMEQRGILHVVPFAGAEARHLHVYSKVGPTPPGVPRRPGMARKRPLG